MTRHGTIAALLATVVVVLAACGAQRGGSASPTVTVSTAPSTASASADHVPARSSSASVADDCSAMDVSAGYCSRIGNWIRQHRRLPSGTPLRLEEIPFTCHDKNGKEVLCTLGGAPPRTIRATTDAGVTFELPLPCAGIPSSAICYEHPPLAAAAMEAYWDVPCSGEGPSGCATPPPIDPKSLANARPLVIDSIEVPVAPTGHREVEIGRAILPNGVLSHASFDLEESGQSQTGFIIDPMTVRLLVRSTDPSRPPFNNVYTRGRFPGVEEVDAVIVFDVVEASPTAVLHIHNVDVH